MTFYADLGNGSKNVEQRKITYDATAKTITESVYPGTGVYPDLTFPVAPTQTRARPLLNKVERANEKEKSRPSLSALLRFRLGRRPRRATPSCPPR